MNQAPENECSQGVCKVARRPTSLPSPFIHTRMEINPADLTADLQGVQAAGNTFGNESRLKYGRLLIPGECDKEDHNGAAEKSYQRKSLLKRRRHSEPLHSAHAEAQLNSTGSSADSSGSSLLLENHNTRNFRKKDVTAAKAFFPDFFPQQPLRDRYDCLHSHPTLEQIFSGQIKS